MGELRQVFLISTRRIRFDLLIFSACCKIDLLEKKAIISFQLANRGEHLCLINACRLGSFSVQASDVMKAVQLFTSTSIPSSLAGVPLLISNALTCAGGSRRANQPNIANSRR